MTEALAIPEPSRPEPLVPFGTMAPERRALMRELCRANGSDRQRALTDAEMEMLCEIGIRSGLDPFQKQIYGIVLQGQFTIVTGIGGFRAVARRNGLAGIDAPKFAWADEKKTQLLACEITVYRWGPPAVDGTRQKEAYTGRCLFREFVKGTPIWKEKPGHMLAIRTEAHVLRMAFTEWLGGLYEHGEIADSPIGRATHVAAGPKDPRALLAPDTAEPSVEADAEIVDGEHDPRDQEAP